MVPRNGHNGRLRDVVPVSSLGRAVGAVLMVSGIAILSVFISSLGAFLIKTAAPKRSQTRSKRLSRRESTT
ncbi:MAG: hypothetical protein ACO2O1_05965 [Candidatus Caldarchaeales archaeon]